MRIRTTLILIGLVGNILLAAVLYGLYSSSGEESSSSGKISFSGSQKVPLSPLGSQLEMVSKDVSRV